MKTWSFSSQLSWVITRREAQTNCPYLLLIAKAHAGSHCNRREKECARYFDHLKVHITRENQHQEIHKRKRGDSVNNLVLSKPLWIFLIFYIVLLSHACFGFYPMTYSTKAFKAPTLFEALHHNQWLVLQTGILVSWKQAVYLPFTFLLLSYFHTVASSMDNGNCCALNNYF